MKLKKAYEEYISEGIHFGKLINAGGLFSSPTYDYRVAYSIEEVEKLLIEGFKLRYDAGTIALNIIHKATQE